MTLDEHIECAKSLAEIYRQQFLVSPAEKQDELAMLLEELKCYRNSKSFDEYSDKLYDYAYNKAIDDFMKYIDHMIAKGIFNLSPFIIKEYLEQLKAGAKNDD